MRYRLGDYDCPACGYAQPQPGLDPPPAAVPPGPQYPPARPEPVKRGWPRGVVPAGYPAFRLEFILHLILLAAALVYIYLLSRESKTLQLFFGSLCAGRHSHVQSVKQALSLYSIYMIWLYPLAGAGVLLLSWANISSASTMQDFWAAYSIRGPRSTAGSCVSTGLMVGALFLLTYWQFRPAMDGATYCMFGFMVLGMLWSERLRWIYCSFFAEQGV